MQLVVARQYNTQLWTEGWCTVPIHELKALLAAHAAAKLDHIPGLPGQGSSPNPSGRPTVTSKLFPRVKAIKRSHETTGAGLWDGARYTTDPDTLEQLYREDREALWTTPPPHIGACPAGAHVLVSETHHKKHHHSH